MVVVVWAMGTAAGRGSRRKSWLKRAVEVKAKRSSGSGRRRGKRWTEGSPLRSLYQPGLGSLQAVGRLKSLAGVTRGVWEVEHLVWQVAAGGGQEKVGRNPHTLSQGGEHWRVTCATPQRPPPTAEGQGRQPGSPKAGRPPGQSPAAPGSPQCAALPPRTPCPVPCCRRKLRISVSPPLSSLAGCCSRICKAY